MFRNLLLHTNTIAPRASYANANLGRTGLPLLFSRRLTDDQSDQKAQGIVDAIKALEQLLERLSIEEKMRQEGNYGHWVGFNDEEVEAYKARQAEKNKAKPG